MPNLIISRQDDADEVRASAKDVREALQVMKEASSALSFALGQLSKARPVEMSEKTPTEGNEVSGSDMMAILDIMPGISSVEYKWANALKLLGIPSVIGRDIENRHASLRKANETIRSLTEQMGKSVSADHIQAGIKRATGLVNQWWKSCGFAYVSSVVFKEYNCSITASLLQPETRSLEKDMDDGLRVEEVWAKQMAERGWQTIKEDGGRDRYILDNDVNACILKDAILARFPSAHIRERKSTSVYGKPDMMIREVDFIVSLSDILNCEDAETEQDNG